MKHTLLPLDGKVLTTISPGSPTRIIKTRILVYEAHSTWRRQTGNQRIVTTYSAWSDTHGIRAGGKGEGSLETREGNHGELTLFELTL